MMRPKISVTVLCASSFLCAVVSVNAQQPAGASPGQNAIGGNAQGGSAQADFDSLIDLIESTVATDTWAENGTGEGEISPFAINGVFADASGTLRFAKPKKNLAAVQVAAQSSKKKIDQDVRKSSELRFVSLPRLEAAIRARQAQHQPLLPEMLTLAGLERIEYVLVAPETGDLILAGPAGDWRVREDGILVSITTGAPVVRLDDLLTLWRRAQFQKKSSFGVSIIPRQAALAATQQFVQASNAQPIEPTQRGQWLKDLRNTLGKQDIEFFGIAPDSHVAQVLLVADYHMKLIGMGIADGVEGVEDYLSTVKLLADGTPPPMSVLRWWFTMHYEPVEVSAEREVFHLQGQGVKVLSENEILAARGQRIHTGQSDELNRRFAASFTEHFQALSERYPLYGELRNVFDIALVLSLIEQEGLTERVGWQAELFSNPDTLRLPKVAVPKTVETVINHRMLRRKHIVAGISGGVWIDGRKNLKINSAASNAAPKISTLKIPAANHKDQTWWWD